VTHGSGVVEIIQNVGLHLDNQLEKVLDEYYFTLGWFKMGSYSLGKN
jgi:hypothetical protein